MTNSDRVKWMAASVAVLGAAGALGVLVLIKGPLAIGDDDSTTIRRLSGEDARAIRESEFPVYGVGDEYDGLPLVAANATKSQPPAGNPEPPTDSVHLIYGECTPRGGNGLDGPTCVPPVQIRTHAYCTRPLELLAPEIRNGERLSIRGATAYWTSPLPMRPPLLRLYTGEVAITILAETEERVLAITAELYSMTPGLGHQAAHEELGPVTMSC